MPDTVKLQAFLAQMGIASRRKSELLIGEGKVTVNGQPAHIGQRINPAKDQVLFEGQPVGANSDAELIYFLVNKPIGYVSSTQDELDRRTVLDLLPQDIIKNNRVFPVGRLDIDSRGLMLITNDGALTQSLTHPSFEHKKVYEVLVEGIPSSKALDHLERGVKLKDGYAKPDEYEILSHQEGNTWIEITIHEGKNRLVRRMMDRIGYPVIDLLRIQMGPFSLDLLANKHYIQLTPSEVNQLLSRA